MRIIAGKYKHKKIVCPNGDFTRPTTDKNRESLFNILLSTYYVEDADVLDLFSGTGALGIEALSRGAKSAIFVDKNPKALAITKENLQFVKEPCKVYNTDWKVAVEKFAGSKFDIIFIDPPYKKKIENDIVNDIIKSDILSESGCIVIEHSTDNILEFDNNLFDVYPKKYGATSFTILSYKE